MTLDREFKLAAKVIVFSMLWLVCLVALFRVVIPLLWGEPTSLAPFTAIAAAIVGVLALAYLALIMVRSVRRDFQSNPDVKGTADHG